MISIDFDIIKSRSIYLFFRHIGAAKQADMIAISSLYQVANMLAISRLRYLSIQQTRSRINIHSMSCFCHLADVNPISTLRLACFLVKQLWSFAAKCSIMFTKLVANFVSVVWCWPGCAH